MRHWLPPILWSAIVLAASSDLFSASHSGAFLRGIITLVFGPPDEDIFAMIHFAARKSVHLIAYGILGALWFRALRISRVARAFVLACALATLVAAIDEAHQATLKSRTGTPADVALDLAGAAIGAGILRRFSAPAASASPA